MVAYGITTSHDKHNLHLHVGSGFWWPGITPPRNISAKAEMRMERSRVSSLKAGMSPIKEILSVQNTVLTMMLTSVSHITNASRAFTQRGA